MSEKTYEVELPFNGEISTDLLALAAGDMIHHVEVAIVTPWSAAGSTIQIGIAGNLSKYLATGDSTLNGAAGNVYTKRSDKLLAAGETLKATYSRVGGPAAGLARVVIFYSTPDQQVIPPAAPLFGYYTGGADGAVVYAQTDGLDFYSDASAMVAKGALSAGKFRAAACNSASFGYLSGGTLSVGGALSATEALDFANDANPMVAKGALVTARFEHTAANSPTFGYFSGGQTAAGFGFELTSTNGLDFANDAAVMTAKGVLTLARARLEAFNSSTFGYFLGGLNGGGIPQTTNDGLDFANDAAAMVAKGSIGVAFSWMACYNSTTFGYRSTGLDSVGADSSASRALDFSNDAVAMVAKGAATAAKSRCGASNSLSFGYVSGGSSTAPAFFNNTDAMNFASDAFAMTAKGVLVTARRWLSGYQGGGIL